MAGGGMTEQPLSGEERDRQALREAAEQTLREGDNVALVFAEELLEALDALAAAEQRAEDAEKAAMRWMKKAQDAEGQLDEAVRVLREIEQHSPNWMEDDAVRKSDLYKSDLARDFLARYEGAD